MSKFVKKVSKKQPAVSTAALPDIVFMLLFFFMVAASIKSSNYEKFIKIDLPKGNELSQVEKRDLINYVYVGRPSDAYKARYGTQPIVVIDDVIASNLRADVRNAADRWRAKTKPEFYNELQTMLSIDIRSKLGLVQELKDELGRNNLQKVVYTAQRGDMNLNFRQ